MNQLPFIFNFISKMVILKKNKIYLALKFRVIDFLSSLNPIAFILAKSKHSAVNGDLRCHLPFGHSAQAQGSEGIRVRANI